MIRLENHLGKIDVSEDFFVNLVGATVTQCFGVAGMATAGPTQGIKNYLKSRGRLLFSGAPDRGIRIRCLRGRMDVELHILITYGTNVHAVTQSITEKVKYAVEEASGLSVNNVVVFVDGMTNN